MIYLLLVVSFFIGFNLREIREQLYRINKALEKLRTTTEPEPTSITVEPMSAEAFARQQHEQMMKDINQ